MSQNDQTNPNAQNNEPIDLSAEMFRSTEKVKDVTLQMYKNLDSTLMNVEGKYGEIDDIALFEGDIALATLEEVEEAKKKADAKGIGIKGDDFRWGGAGASQVTIPYVTVPELEPLVKKAIAHWEFKT